MDGENSRTLRIQAEQFLTTVIEELTVQELRVRYEGKVGTSYVLEGTQLSLGPILRVDSVNTAEPEPIKPVVEGAASGES